MSAELLAQQRLGHDCPRCNVAHTPGGQRCHTDCIIELTKVQMLHAEIILIRLSNIYNLLLESI